MDPASCSNFELHNYAQAPQNDTESGVRQDDRSCGTRAFKWIVRHPFLTAVATIGLLGAASAGIYGLTLLGAAAPVATALSSRNVTAKALATNASTTEAPTTEASTTEAPTTEAPTFFRSYDEEKLNALCRRHDCTYYAINATCSENHRIKTICCDAPTPYWKSGFRGRDYIISNGKITPLSCDNGKSELCTNHSPMFYSYTNILHRLDSTDRYCQHGGWGNAIYRIR
ncbi:hypothetical protein ACTL6P_11950 [Endozoicomonas acroporae]|uniref:hypothetical protein n=1 Tax=Endozoicomonas acroporae TaxID=1701104 RepID=UPI000C774D6D|nr:hypothetical protein [Endozoicomonas acroporae]